MDYITQTLGIPVHRSKWERAAELPFYLTNSYSLESAELGDRHALFLTPVGKLGTIGTIKKHIARLETICPWPVVLELPALSRQRKSSLIAERIPFVVPGKQLYLPFLGAVLSERNDVEAAPEPIDKLLPSAQMLLFAFILGGNKLIFLSDMTKRFHCAAMTMSRAAQQLVQAGLLDRSTQGVQILLSSDLTPWALYQTALPHLISPVRKTVYIDRAELPKDVFSAGLSALSEQAFINPPFVESWGTVAQEKSFTTKSMLLVDTTKQCAVEFWKYDPRLVSGSLYVDPLSLAASLSDTSDERVEQSVDTLLREALQNGHRI